MFDLLALLALLVSMMAPTSVDSYVDPGLAEAPDADNGSVVASDDGSMPPPPGNR